MQNYTPSDQSELDELLLGLARGLQAIHSAGFIHCDFQPRNILLMKDKTVKIADFGLATRKGAKMPFFGPGYHRVGVFNPDDTEDAQEKIDIFSFGFVMRTLSLKAKAVYSPTLTPRRELSDECCRQIPAHRISIDEVVSRLQVIQLEAEALRNEEVRRKEENEASTKSKRSSITEQFSKKKTKWW